MGRSGEVGGASPTGQWHGKGGAEGQRSESIKAERGKDRGVGRKQEVGNWGDGKLGSKVGGC